MKKLRIITWQVLETWQVYCAGKGKTALAHGLRIMLLPSRSPNIFQDLLSGEGSFRGGQT